MTRPNSPHGPSRNRRAALVALCLLGLTLPSLPPTGASSCEDTNSGFGDEGASCNFDCNPDEYIQVSGSVDDDGTIEVNGSCGGAGAHCLGAGFCQGSSLPRTTAYNDWGSCHGDGNGGAWTRVHIACQTQTMGSGVGSVDRILQNLRDRLDGRLPPIVVDFGLKELTLLVLERDEQGGVLGYALTCDAAACRDRDVLATVDPLDGSWTLSA